MANSPLSLQGYRARDQAIFGPDSLWVHTRDFDPGDLKQRPDFWPMPAYPFFRALERFSNAQSMAFITYYR